MLIFFSLHFRVWELDWVQLSQPKNASFNVFVTNEIKEVQDFLEIYDIKKKVKKRM